MIQPGVGKGCRAVGAGALAAVLVLAGLVTRLPAKETFRARMLTGKASFAQAQIDVKIEIDSWTTPEEITKFQETINRGGFNAFEGAFTAAKKGLAKFMSPGGLGLTIHAALSIPLEKGRRILLFFNHQPWDSTSTFMQNFSAPYMVMDIKLDENGTGDGYFYEFAEVAMRPQKGTIEMTAFNAAPKTFPFVQETTKKRK